MTKQSVRTYDMIPITEGQTIARAVHNPARVILTPRQGLNNWLVEFNLDDGHTERIGRFTSDRHLYNPRVLTIKPNPRHTRYEVTLVSDNSGISEGVYMSDGDAYYRDREGVWTKLNLDGDPSGNEVTRFDDHMMRMARPARLKVEPL